MPPASPPDAPAASRATAPASPRELFSVFARIGLIGFGGVLPWTHRVLVDERRWLDEHEYLAMISLGQILPGPNVCNLALMFGHRCFGWRGAVAALGGLVGLPFALVLVVAALYAHIADQPLVTRAMHGMAAVVAGLVIAVALRMARALPRRAAPFVMLAATFGAIGVLHWPLASVFVVVAPLSIVLAWRGARR